MPKPTIGYKLLAADEGSLSTEYPRVFYKIGVRTTVPGNGAYVALTGGLLSLQQDSPDKIFAKLECEDPVSPASPPPQGTTCFRVVTRVPLTQDDLAKVAVDAQNDDVRRTAVARLDDQSLLAKLAVQDQDCDVRRTAVARLDDQALLAKLAVQDQDYDVRRAAVARLDDQSLLAKVAVDAQDDDIRQATVARLDDQALLAKLAIDAQNWTVRQAAVARLESLQKTP
jgi:hypothetical protein